MKYIVVIFLFCFLVNKLSAQKNVSFETFAGYGFFESIYTGLSTEYSNSHMKSALSFGYCPINTEDQIYYSIMFEQMIAIFRHKTYNNDFHKWYASSKLIYWHLIDNYYNWDVFTISPCVYRYVYFSNRWKIGLYGGIAFNIVLHNERKTFKQVGWPYHVMPEYGFHLSYKINNK